MKEFWLEPEADLPEDAIRRIVEEARPQAVLLHRKILGLNTRIASRQTGADILVTSSPDEATRAKKNKTLVALELTIADRKDQQKVEEALELHPDYLLVNCPNWKIIPLENIIAEVNGRAKLLARTRSFEESKAALATLELGADGILLAPHSPGEILKTRDLVLGDSVDVSLSSAKITSVKAIGTGSRVCVDTCEILHTGEGLLTGCSSQGLFLLEGEVHSNPHVNPRPFRVNAGPVSLYVLTPGGKTRYLSELSAGETVLLVDAKGKTRPVDVARVKIERRPMLLIEAETGSQTVKTIVQNAETVRLVTPTISRPVTELKPGDEVSVRLEEGARHFGTKVSGEMIIER